MFYYTALKPHMFLNSKSTLGQNSWLINRLHPKYASENIISQIEKIIEKENSLGTVSLHTAQECVLFLYVVS